MKPESTARCITRTTTLQRHSCQVVVIPASDALMSLLRLRADYLSGITADYKIRILSMLNKTWINRGAKNFAPPQTPFPGARDGQNLISWRWSLPLPTNPVWWGSMHAVSSYRGNRPTNTKPPPHTQTDRTDYITLRRS